MSNFGKIAIALTGASILVGVIAGIKESKETKEAEEAEVETEENENEEDTYGKNAVKFVFETYVLARLATGLKMSRHDAVRLTAGSAVVKGYAEIMTEAGYIIGFAIGAKKEKPIKDFFKILNLKGKQTASEFKDAFGFIKLAGDIGSMC